jgi:hypothetical protein
LYVPQVRCARVVGARSAFVSDPSILLDTAVLNGPPVTNFSNNETGGLYPNLAV